jgi:RNA polymerase sigma-70 factor, ECF subfamily
MTTETPRATTEPAAPDAGQEGLLSAARAGDGDAFGRLVEPYRRELHAHCYRMLGSYTDAEDALQDALLRAWRGLRGFEGRSSLRSWLYRIATNACLRAIERRPARILPVDFGPAADPHDGPDDPIGDPIWLEPYPDTHLGLAGPDARYEQREAVELAFIAALQHLPARQRAVLILRDVLGFSARETAGLLDITPVSVDSALQRAHKTVDERLPSRSQQETLRLLGDDELRSIVERYVDAWERKDVHAFVTLLAEDARIAMPPLPSWFSGREQVGTFLRLFAIDEVPRWRVVATTANGQLALAAYAWNNQANAFRPHCLNVLTIRDGLVDEIMAFLDPDSFNRFGLAATIPG